MTANFAPTIGGTTFTYGPWKIGLFIQTTEVGGELLLAYDDPGSGWVGVATIAGPWLQGSWVDAFTAAGGQGSWIIGQLPKINALLTKYFNTQPNLPVEQNVSTYSADDFNAMLSQYISMKALPGDTHPTAYVHAANQP